MSITLIRFGIQEIGPNHFDFQTKRGQAMQIVQVSHNASKEKQNSQLAEQSVVNFLKSNENKMFIDDIAEQYLRDGTYSTYFDYIPDGFIQKITEIFGGEDHHINSIQEELEGEFEDHGVIDSVLYEKSRLAFNTHYLRDGYVLCILNALDYYLAHSKAMQVTLENARCLYPLSSSLSIGTYTLHPLSSQKLVKLERYHEALALEKDDELIVLLGKMGAKSVLIREMKTNGEKGSGGINLEGAIASISGSGQVTSKTKDAKELLVEFQGSRPGMLANILNESLWFRDDSKLISIFESVKNESNPLKKYSLSLTYSESFDFDFDLASRFLIAKVDLKAAYEKVASCERLFEVCF